MKLLYTSQKIILVSLILRVFFGVECEKPSA